MNKFNMFITSLCVLLLINQGPGIKGTVDFSSVSRPSSDALSAHGSNERLALWPSLRAGSSVEGLGN